MRTARRLVLAILTLTAALALAPGSPASATSATLTATIAPEWGRGDLRIVRDEWTVRVGGTLTDTRADGDCVYVEAVLAVDHFTDPDGRIPDHCGGKGTSAPISISLRPSGGSRLATIRVRVCAADAFADSCLERTYTVPSERAVRPDLKDEVDTYMNMSMARFKSAKATTPGPFNWSADGCSTSPAYPGGFNFKDACNRHDFGYRNYGKGSIKASPFDATREFVDNRFRSDLMNECARYSGSARTDCEGYAQSYFLAVRTQAGKAFYEA